MPQEPLGKRPRGQFTLRDLLVATAVIALLLGLVMSALQHARALRNRDYCAINLRHLAIATRTYHDAYVCFPAAYTVDKDGHRLNSWRALLLGFLDSRAFFPKYRHDAPWDSTANLPFTTQSLPYHHCPSDPSAAPSETNYTLIVGPGMFADGSSPIQFEDIKDGVSNTIMFVETVDLKIPWAAPRDLEADKITFEINPAKTPGISSNHPGGANCAFVDGSVRFLSNSTPPQQVRAMCTRAGGETVAP